MAGPPSPRGAGLGRGDDPRGVPLAADFPASALERRLAAGLQRLRAPSAGDPSRSPSTPTHARSTAITRARPGSSGVSQGRGSVVPGRTPRRLPTAGSASHPGRDRGARVPPSRETFCRPSGGWCSVRLRPGSAGPWSTPWPGVEFIIPMVPPGGAAEQFFRRGRGGSSSTRSATAGPGPNRRGAGRVVPARAPPSAVLALHRPPGATGGFAAPRLSAGPGPRARTRADSSYGVAC